MNSSLRLVVKSWWSLGCLAAGLSCSEVPEVGDGAGEMCGGLSPLPGARLLTAAEYQNTVRDLLGEEAQVTEAFPAEPIASGMNNNASTHVVNPLLLEQYLKTARLLSENALSREPSPLPDCAEPGRACAEVFVDTFGRRAYRRPLESDERKSLLRLYDLGAPGLGHEGAISTLIETMLQSPQFLYRVEALVSDDQEPETEQPLGGFELASRLSYLLWGSMPDDELLAAAERGDLDSQSGIDHQARRLLSDPRARARVREFHTRWLGVDRLRSIVRDGAPDKVGLLYLESLLRFMDEVFWEDGGIPELLTRDAVYAEESLAELLELPLQGRSDAGGGFQRVTGTVHYRGLLAQPGLLAMLSHPAQSSPIARGVFVREYLMCDPVPAPPPDVDNSPPDPDPKLTTRERFAVHTESPACAGCHSLIDPLGFGFEAYDALGRYRSAENGLSIDTSGELVNTKDESLNGPFEGTRELQDRLKESPLLLNCLTSTWLKFALGRAPTVSDECAADEISSSSFDESASMKELLLSIVASDAFRKRGPIREGDLP